MQLETLAQEGGTGATGSTPLSVQHFRIATESMEGDRPIGGNGEATGDVRQEIAAPPIFGTATPILQESLMVVDESSFERTYVGERAPRKAIRPTVRPEAQAFLSDSVRALLEPLMSISAMKANQAAIPIDSIDIGSFRDPEEGWMEVVLNISVVANAPQALAFWDSIGRAIDRWKQFLPRRLAETLDDRIGVHVYWS